MIVLRPESDRNPSGIHAESMPLYRYTPHTRHNTAGIATQPSPKRQVANARAALDSVKSAKSGEGWLGDALGLEASR